MRTVRHRANVLDKSFNLCGARFGWTLIIGTAPIPFLLHSLAPPLLPFSPCSSGPRLPFSASFTHPGTHVICCPTALVPVVGDALNPVLSYLLVVRQASKAKYVFPPVLIPPLPIAFSSSHLTHAVFLPLFLPLPIHLYRLPKALTRRMILNLAISAAIGIVPILGDVLLASYRANVRNARLLENFLRLRGERLTKGGARPATLEEKNNDNDEDRVGGSRGAGGFTEDEASALPDIPPPVSLSQPGATASSVDGEKTTRVPDTVEGGDRDRGDTPVPDSGRDDGATFLRPPRSPLGLVQHRDSRFIEDVS